jgi:hypothetical protein
VTGAPAPELAWTPLSRRLGLTRTARQRKQILTALAGMAWSADISSGLAQVDGQAARAIVAAVYHHRRDQLRLVGTAALPDGHQLVGLEHADGARNYLLDLDAEAIHLLAEIPTADPRVAWNARRTT